ncbi:elongation factor Ts [Pavlovales sp. CCMP2436]|nr:elongation factor Ts [Pavlovales sp. CCMP2436]
MLARFLHTVPRARVAVVCARSFSQSVSAEMVKQLRQRTGAPIIKCKQALEAEGGDLDAATSWLRKSGIATAAKKAGRGANEGVVGIAAAPTRDRVAVLELNSETDFVARNDVFQKLSRAIAMAALDAPVPSAGTITELPVSTLLAQRLGVDGLTAEEAIVTGVTTLGENLLLRRACVLRATNGIVASYVHNTYAPGFGRTAAAVVLEAPGASAEALDTVSELGQKIAMHIVAASPLYLCREEVPAEKVEAEKEVIRAQAAVSKKSEAVVDKIVQGKLGKFFEDTVLLDQSYVLEPDAGNVGKLVSTWAKTHGVEVTVTGFVRYQLGQGNEPAATESS